MTRSANPQRSTQTGMWRGKKRRMVHKKSRRQTSIPTNTRTAAALIRGDWRTHGAGLAATRRRSWVPKKGRRKAGARRKVTLIEKIIRWIPIDTGRVRKTTRRRR